MIWALLLVSALFTLLAVVLLDLLSNKSGREQATRQIWANLLAMRLFADEPRTVLRCFGGLIKANARLLFSTLPALIVIALLFLFLYAPMNAFFSSAPLTVGTPRVLTVRLSHLDNNWPDARLETPDWIIVDSPPIHVLPDKEISWRIHATKLAPGTIRIFIGNQVINYPLQWQPGLSTSVTLSANEPTLDWLLWISIFSLLFALPLSRLKSRAMKLLLVGLLAITLSAANLDDANKQLSRAIFKQLIEINTTDSVGNVTTAAEAMRKRLLDAGFPAADVVVMGPNDRKGNMVARFRGTGKGKPILIIAHLDVVEAKRSDWTSDPFQFVEKDGYFYGRGTQDMKCGDAIAITTFIRFVKEGYKPDRDIVLALTADEEGGTSNGVDWLLKHHRELIDADYALNPDAGGVTTDKGKPIDVEVEATEKLYADFQLTATNPGGHSSLPTSENAIYEIADALGRLEKTPFPFELNNVTRAWFSQVADSEAAPVAADIRAMLKTPPDEAAIARLSKNPRFNSTIRTTCVATRLSGGHADNALPQTAQALVNCRILPGHSAEEVRQDLIRVFADPKITLKYKDTLTAEDVDKAPDTKAFLPPPLRKDVMDSLRTIAEKMWPSAPVIPEMETGASDSIYTIAAGIPSYGINGVAIDSDDVRAHGKDERLRVDSYYRGVEFYYSFLKAITSQTSR